MFKLKLWLIEAAHIKHHRQLHAGRKLNSQSVACESHILPSAITTVLNGKTTRKCGVVFFETDTMVFLFFHTLEDNSSEIYRELSFYCHAVTKIGGRSSCNIFFYRSVFSSDPCVDTDHLCF